ncbi:SHOCT domain-containing protein [Agromyces sp. M3QZ16-3]|uniref:SHOCT domain-containing protein n=1 Tax=Agromyces sp. M3QZ16-3 TaxID=3447585 RepID=UPI003F68E1C5
MMWDYGFGGWWMWLPGLLFGALVIGGIAVLIVLLVRSASGHGGADRGVRPYGEGGATSDAAMQILEERFARGEISADEFRMSASTLREARRGPG